MVPVVASLVVGTFTGVRYVVNLTDSINTSEQQIINLERDLKQAQKNIAEINTRLSATWPLITEAKAAPDDAKEWENKPDKLKLLEE